MLRAGGEAGPQSREVTGAMDAVRLVCGVYWAGLVAAMCVLHVLLALLDTFESQWSSAAAPPLLRRMVWILRDASSYGKTKAKDHSPLLNVPKRWFVHFYIVGLGATGLLLWRISDSDSNRDTVTRYRLGIYLLSMLRRFLECVVVSRFSPRARMHLLHYLLGMSYYLTMPLTIASCSHKDAPPAFLEPGRSVGLGLFVAGSLAQSHSHYVLANLRRGPADCNDYKLPRGGLFEVVSCPHYLAEIVLYGGLTVLCDGDLAMVLALAFITLELCVAARQQHRWYQATFPAFPLHRKALFPFLL